MGKGDWLIGNCESSMVKGVVEGAGVGAAAVKVGAAVAWLTDVFAADMVVAVGVGIEVEMAGMISGTGVDWQAVNIVKLNNKIFNGYL